MTPTPEQITAMVHRLRSTPLSLATDVQALLDAEARCGQAIPDGYGMGGSGGSGAHGGRPVESAVLARESATDEHARLTELARRSLAEAASAAVLVDADVAALMDRAASRQTGGPDGWVRSLRATPADTLEALQAPRSDLDPVRLGTMRASIHAGLSAACSGLSVAVSAVDRCRALTGPRRDPQTCDIPGCGRSAATEAGGRRGRCQWCTSWLRDHPGVGQPTEAIIRARDRGDGVVVARLSAILGRLAAMG